MKAGLDIGNTRVKWVNFDERPFQMEILNRSTEQITDFILEKGTTELIVTSVAGNLVNDVKLTQELDLFIWLDHHTPLPVELNYKTPETLGRDRIAAVVGANSLYPNQNSLVIDIGTCMTLDVITKNGEFIGGNISPGLELRYRAMDEFTANLPGVERKIIDHDLGLTTEEALVQGGIIGIASEIEGYIRRLEGGFANLNVILTGGDSLFFAKYLNREIFLHPDLVFIGLQEILSFNAA